MNADQQMLIQAISLSPLAMVVTNPRLPDNPLEMVNQAFCDLTGYSESEIVGRNCRFLAGEGTEQSGQAQMRSAISQRRAVLAEVTNYRRDGSAFRNGVMISPLLDDEGKLLWFLGSQVDLGAGPTNRLADRRAAAKEKVAVLPLRQLQVLAGMAKGQLNKQIAWELGISEKTVKMHRALLLERLGVATSAEAIRTAVEAGL